MNKAIPAVVLGLVAASRAVAGAPMPAELFVGLDSPVATRSSDLSGFPDVTWNDHFAIEVIGAAAAPDGTLYLCNGSFTSRLYRSVDLGTPVFLATLSEDMWGLAYGRGDLYGYSNFAPAKGIYRIDTDTGLCTLVLDVYTGTGFRFFALGYNPADDLFYGYTTFGDSGLYSINIDTGEMIKIVGAIPAGNTQGLGLAVGNNTVYLTATRGDDGIPCFAYDLSQGLNGVWTPFTQPYPAFHSTGGAAWIPGNGCPCDLSGDGVLDLTDISALVVAFMNGDPAADMNGDGVLDLDDVSGFITCFLGGCP